ncbi:SGNH/GDSL hydrolase family protein [Microbacterium invictum]|uniref:SGNH/GDSL hydrolase family protein n=1 Tax=Microbacterium invictum TaxID=515415 RepID=A0ABZ0VAH6_9MICO|nr:SGNH/GDSL hydrolase family protein [Microbacterium invictum]WQB69888.1 SGNH/GDSL hydrolase family protein [Microbacterium invictum]
MGERARRRRRARLRRVGTVLGGILFIAALTFGWLALTLGPLNGVARAAAPPASDNAEAATAEAAPAPAATPLLPTPVFPDGPAVPAPAPPPPPPAAWVIGDSQAAADASWVARAPAELGYDVTLSARGGIGFVAAPPASGTTPAHPGIRDALAAGLWQPPADPALIIVQSGGNDQTFPIDHVRAAAEASLDQLGAAYPDATLVVVGPLVQVDAWAPQRRAVSETLADVAAARHVAFVDTTGWVASSRLQQFLVDDRHFSPAGHDALTGIFARALAGLGVSDPAATAPSAAS